MLPYDDSQPQRLRGLSNTEGGGGCYPLETDRITTTVKLDLELERLLPSFSRLDLVKWNGLSDVSAHLLHLLIVT